MSQTILPPLGSLWVAEHPFSLSLSPRGRTKAETIEVAYGETLLVVERDPPWVRLLTGNRTGWSFFSSLTANASPMLSGSLPSEGDT